MKLTKGQRAQQQRAKKREKREAWEKRTEELEALQAGFSERLDLRLAIRAAVERVKLDRLRDEWNRLGGPKLTSRLASLEDASVKRTYAKKVREACRAVFGAPPKRKLVVQHNRADFVSDWDRFGDEVLYSWLEIRGVRGVIQSGGSQMQVQSERRIYGWRVENYRMDVEDTTSIISWLKKSIALVKSGDAAAQVKQLEAKYKRDHHSTRTTITVPAEPVVAPVKKVATKRFIAVPRPLNGRMYWDVYSWNHEQFYGRYGDWSEIERTYAGEQTIRHQNGRVETYHATVTNNPDDWRPVNQSTYWS